MSKNIVFAIAYDFDGTLSADNMQEYEFIPRLGVSSAEFWHEFPRPNPNLYVLDVT